MEIYTILLLVLETLIPACFLIIIKNCRINFDEKQNTLVLHSSVNYNIHKCGV